MINCIPHEDLQIYLKHFSVQGLLHETQGNIIFYSMKYNICSVITFATTDLYL